MKKNKNDKTYFIEVNGSRAYFNYNTDTQEYSRGDKRLMVFKEVFEDFIRTAQTLGFKAGEL